MLPLQKMQEKTSSSWTQMEMLAVHPLRRCHRAVYHQGSEESGIKKCNMAYNEQESALCDIQAVNRTDRFTSFAYISLSLE